jgi:DNA excision repair protein ERCC-4
MSTTTNAMIVCPFTVAVDTREQAAYGFENLPFLGARGNIRLAVPCKRRTLASGDYSLVGFEDRVAVERKSLPDLFSTLGQGRKRFEREFERLSEMEFAAIVIEADAREIWRPTEFHPGWRSRLNPRSVEGTIVAWSLRYPGVHWWAMGSRRNAEVRTFEVLEMFWRMTQHEDVKNGGQR